jgi:DNA-binding response OmpR family regulator
MIGLSKLEGRVAEMEMRTQPLVLVIDDQFEIAELLQTILEDDGYAVEICTEAREATGQILDKQPDLVMLDVRMPGADGWQILQELRQNATTFETPVIMMSAASDKLPVYQELANHYRAEILLKPFNNNAMRNQVQNLAPVPNFF